VINRGPQAAVVIIVKRDESERLQNASSRFPCRREKFGHPVHRARLGLKGDFDKIALAKRRGHLQQTAGDGNGLKFSFGAAAIF
jgi:hypothetical protein